MIRRLVLSAAVSASFVFAPLQASADEPNPNADVERPRGDSYALPLAFSYAAPPALMLAAAGAFSGADESLAGGMMAAGAVVGLAAPISVHAVNGEGRRAWLSAVGAMGSTLGVGVLGALIGGSQCPSKRSQDRTVDDTDCYDGLVGAGIGMMVGYVGWAAVDVALFSRSKPARATSPTASIGAAVTPRTSGLVLRGSF